MKKLSLTLLSLAMAFVGFAQSPCSQLNANFTVSQNSNVVSMTNTSTLPTGGTNVSSWAIAYCGDGGYAYPSPTDNHTYLTNGTFTITFIQYWMDSVGSNSVFCADTAYQTVTITTAPPPPPPSPCAFNAAGVNNGNGNFTFTAYSNNTGMSYSWNFGDNTTGSGNPVTHTYTSPGFYTVWVTGTGNGCTKTDSVGVYYQAPNPVVNQITGSVGYDSALVTGAINFKVWLIKQGYDSATSSITLTAVDSVTTPSQMYWANYTFSNVAPGTYYTKARVAPGATNPGLIPTYHQNSAYWNTATVINHSGGNSQYKHILMLAGTPTSGPGFIGGSVTQGAGKGTSTGIPNQLILVRDANNNLVASTYTDVNGDYTFGNLATGTYTIYPEEMGLQTTPSSNLVIGSGVNTYSFIDFEKNSTSIKPKTTGVKDVANNVFSIYPNPTKGQVNINWKNGVNGDAQVIISDISGRVVYSQNASTTAPAHIELSNLNQGVYFIKVNTAKGQHTERIVLQ